LNRGSAVRYNDPMARETAFHPITSRKAAGFSDEAGWLWVTNFGDPAAEYRAIREGVGMWDLSPLNKWEFTGPDAVSSALALGPGGMVVVTGTSNGGYATVVYREVPEVVSINLISTGVRVRFSVGRLRRLEAEEPRALRR